jgi:membrane-bound serine protease (ClpP class)
MDTFFLTLGAFLIGIGFLLLVADLFVASGVMMVLAVAGLLIGIAFVFRYDTWIGLYTLVGVVGGVPATSWLLLRFGPLGRVALNQTNAEDTVASMPSNQQLEKLRGRFGKTISALRPAGVVDFDGRRVDSLTEGMMVEPGQWVRCVDVRAGKVIVRPADQPRLSDLETIFNS